MARASTDAAPPPRAWSTLSRTSCPALSASAQARLLNRYKAIPASSTGRRPKRSDKGP
ncbi:hypothetical protein PAERUG_P60_London_6_VIM_2_11_13_04122 [Pseudomonas aeruginosa]|nr:Uncharacterised protein [Pseudomonas aeruginosa]SVJ66988.1 Uncharacterised protein [Klebsiella pneumoniae]CRO14848.1 hypothetical protein PAERUG_P1_London_28_IMP_1_04_05_01098 [Pseudomonas aeruginosa]CRO16685.1 hypothetical protein PAERUG_P4_London_1_VIM_2_10_07_00394 [Pseudomonas aeruginosa]CRP17127.1 hypothetical protein PAERUG_E6_London_17_VIM_2_12_12_01313 [Pseudomonas aeruginosa]